MANNNFKIVPGASLYNIKNIYGDFIDALSESGIINILSNAELIHTAIDSTGQTKVASWESNAPLFSGKTVTLNQGKYIRQNIADHIHLGDVYTTSVTLNNKVTAFLRVRNSEFDENGTQLVYAWNATEGQQTDLPEIEIPPAPYDGPSGMQTEAS